MDTETSPFLDLNDVIAANKAAGQHFFDDTAMASFHSRVETRLIRFRYFVTSESVSMWGGEPRRYTLRRAEDDGRITNIGTYQGFESSADALTHALTL